MNSHTIPWTHRIFPEMRETRSEFTNKWNSRRQIATTISGKETAPWPTAPDGGSLVVVWLIWTESITNRVQLVTEWTGLSGIIRNSGMIIYPRWSKWKWNWSKKLQPHVGDRQLTMWLVVVIEWFLNFFFLEFYLQLFFATYVSASTIFTCLCQLQPSVWYWENDLHPFHHLHFQITPNLQLPWTRVSSFFTMRMQ